MKIVLIGLRGSGKTKIGKILSKELKWNFIDLDQEIEKNEKLKIREIIDKYGWDYFRNKEKEITKKTFPLLNTVIATGGGTICDPANAKILKDNSIVIYLNREPKNCLRYIKEDTNQPKLTNKQSLLEEIHHLFKERDPIYKKHSDIVFQRTDNLEEDTKKILELL